MSLIPKPDFILEIFLQPGEFYWGDSDTRIKTLLGSCVAICIWHPRLMVGGMSHSLLPTRGETKRGELSGRYIDESAELFLLDIAKSGTKPKDYEVKVFGGGNMFSEIKKTDSETVGDRNINMAREILKKYGFSIKKEHVGGDGHRNIIFDLWSGDVWLKHVDKSKNG